MRNYLYDLCDFRLLEQAQRPRRWAMAFLGVEKGAQEGLFFTEGLNADATQERRERAEPA